MINKGTEVELIGYGNTIKTTVTGVEMFHKQLVSALHISAFIKSWDELNGDELNAAHVLSLLPTRIKAKPETIWELSVAV